MASSSARLENPRMKRMPKKRRESNATEQTIMRIATELFSQKGYSGTSISDIANAVGLTNATLYYYVTNKQDLLLRVLESGMEGFLSRLEEICERDLGAREKLRLAIQNHLNFIFDRPDAVAVFLRERRFLEPHLLERYSARVSRYDQLFTSIIAQGVTAQEFPQIDPRLASLSILGMINWVVEWYRPGGRLDRGEIGDIMMDLVLDRLLGQRNR